jgi:choline dehydrogenase
LRPTSRGHIRLASGDPLAAPKITLNYLATAADRKVAADSVVLTRKIAAAPALQKYAPQEFKPGLQFQTEEELIRAAGEVGTTIFHPVGTCKMGRVEDTLAVVDSKLRVIGVNRLRVVDASVMPTITSGNTNSPTIMIAEMAAKFILDKAL